MPSRGGSSEQSNRRVNAENTVSACLIGTGGVAERLKAPVLKTCARGSARSPHVILWRKYKDFQSTAIISDPVDKSQSGH